MRLMGTSDALKRLTASGGIVCSEFFIAFLFIQDAQVVPASDV